MFGITNTPIIIPTWTYDFRTKTIDQVKQDFEPNLGWYFDQSIALPKSWELITLDEKGIRLNNHEITPIIVDVYGTERTFYYNTSLLVSEGHFTFNLTKPGHLKVRCEITEDNVNRAIWMLQTGQPNRIMPEIDLIENDYHSIFFSLHDGTDYEHKTLFTVSTILGKWEGMRTIELVWNGLGLYEWYFEGIRVKRVNKYLPCALDAYLILSVGISEIDSGEPSFLIEKIEFEGAIK